MILGVLVQLLLRALKNHDNEEILQELDKEVLDITSKYPLWYE